MNKIKKLLYLKSFGYDFVDFNIDMDKYEFDFSNLQNQIKNCRLCNLSKNRICSLIDSDVNYKKLMIVDNFAQKEENESYILNSNNGKKLIWLLKKYLNITKKDFYFSYLYKCFNYEKDDTFALKQCLPYFWNEIKLCKPKIVFILGKTTFNNMGFKNFEKLRGVFFQYHQMWILPSFDINFISKNPSFEQDFIDDLKKLKALL